MTRRPQQPTTRELALLALGAASTQPPAPRTEYVTRTVIEQRAPTDDSVRLAREYEDRAWQLVRDRVLLDVPEIAAKLVVADLDHASRERRVLFTVNGRPVDARVPDHDRDDRNWVVRQVAEAVTEAVLRQLFAGGKA